jgi:hypothetical protein
VYREEWDMHFFRQAVGPTGEFGSCFVGQEAHLLRVGGRDEASVEMLEVGFALGDHRGGVNTPADGTLDLGSWGRFTGRKAL